jgi:hypothetical protein
MNLATEYLSTRGIVESTVKALGFELDPAPSVEQFDERLKRKDGFKLLPLIREGIWFPCLRTIKELGHRVFRPLPDLPKDIGPKFIQPKGVPSIPFIPFETWAVKDRVSKPLICTEGPIKTGCIYQAGGYGIGIWGTWGITVKTEDGQSPIELCPQLKEFELFGRNVFLAFDADAVVNRQVRWSVIRNWLALTKAGALVKLLRWPSAEGKGLDDYLFKSCGLDINAQHQKLAELIDRAEEITGLLEPADHRIVVAELRRADLTDTELDQITRILAKKLNVRPSSLHRDAQGSRESKTDHYHPIGHKNSCCALGLEPINGRLFAESV